MSLEIARLAIEVTSATLCFILARFMIKPYQFTGESRYLGLPLGFIFLGFSFIFVIISPVLFIHPLIGWFSHLTRTFAFTFMAATYYFAKPSKDNKRLLWNLTLSLLTVAILTFSIIALLAPHYATTNWNETQLFLRTFNIITLTYIIFHTLKTHVKSPDPTTIWMPLGFIFLAISQYSLLLWYFDHNSISSWGGLITRFAGLSVFLFVAYQTFYHSKEKENEKDLTQR